MRNVDYYDGSRVVVPCVLMVCRLCTKHIGWCNKLCTTVNCTQAPYTQGQTAPRTIRGISKLGREPLGGTIAWIDEKNNLRYEFAKASRQNQIYKGNVYGKRSESDHPFLPCTFLRNRSFLGFNFVTLSFSVRIETLFTFLSIFYLLGTPWIFSIHSELR